MNLIIPMAGRGSRFVNSGTTLPKPLIPIKGKPMLFWALQSLKDFSFSQIIFIVLTDHEKKFKVSEELKRHVRSPFKIIFINEVTDGQLSTTLAAKKYIDTDEDILIVPSDTFVKSDLMEDIKNKFDDTQGIISVANVPGDSWSFARIDGNRRVVEVSEKVRISEFASTGLYYFSNGHHFVQLANMVISNCEKVQEEYYVSSVYKKYIEFGCRIDVSLADEMWDMGTPKSLKMFEKHLDDNRIQISKDGVL